MAKGIAALAVGLVMVTVAAATGQMTGVALAGTAETPYRVLDGYARHGHQERLNTPADEVDWLRKNRFMHGELDDFPADAIVLHRVDVETYLDQAGFQGSYTHLSYGFTDPTDLWVVRKPGTAPFTVVRGLPGAGGITTQVAELQALGARRVIHVGTAGLLSPDVPYGQIIVSDGSYRDGGAFLLAPDAKQQVARPDQEFTARVRAAAARSGLPSARGIGYTMPIYYFQPGSILRDLLAIKGSDKPTFVEMEEGPFFTLATLMGLKAASVVVGSDRLVNDGGRLHQSLWDGDLDALELAAFKVAVDAVQRP
ncbi:nucleoside phosphorylase [Nitrospirillum viridazoti]|uniref:phosphorylase family protein n=1 Tax=Nitrospirillum viridazoti TaxID=3144925 RepID=UPI00119E6918|nr:nucleoside phosphorylase [Nitrospirillum amazonense]